MTNIWSFRFTQINLNGKFDRINANCGYKSFSLSSQGVTNFILVKVIHLLSIRYIEAWIKISSCATVIIHSPSPPSNQLISSPQPHDLFSTWMIKSHSFATVLRMTTPDDWSLFPINVNVERNPWKSKGLFRTMP